MRIKLLKCQICQDWHSPKRNSCPTCGATRIHVTAHQLVHIDRGNYSRPNIQLVSGFSRYNFTAHAAEICRVLNERD